jgi:VIT1/CCC1 family predicted Fe2+/Mn2+ transporter
LRAVAASVTQGDKEARYRANLQGEIDSSALYRTLAEIEADARIAEIYRRLASVEERHAAFWRQRLGGRFPRRPRPGFRSRALAWLARRFGAAFVLPVIDTLEQADSSQYDKQPEAVAARLPQAERSHARILQALAGPTRGIPGGVLGRIEGRHRGVGGNALRAAVLGANDGLVSNLSLVMGVVGAELAPATVLTTGFAGLFAGACSMAMGEWLSVNSSRELYQNQIATEATELAEVPDEEKEELVLIYQAKGLGADEARQFAERLMADKGTALDTLVREELGIDPDELGGSAWAAAATSFVLFSLGAIIPVAPFLALSGNAAVAGTLALSGIAMAGIGAGTTLFTGRGVAFSALRQLAIGLLAAGVTFGMGRLVGMSLAG